MSKPKNLVSVSQLAKLKGQTPQAIRKAIKERRIKAFKVGEQWVVEINETNKADARKAFSRR